MGHRLGLRSLAKNLANSRSVEQPHVVHSRERLLLLHDFGKAVRISSRYQLAIKAHFGRMLR
jgi:hypothetical protein